MRKWPTPTIAFLLLIACEQTSERRPVDTSFADTHQVEIETDDSDAVATAIAVSLDGEGLRFVDTESGKTSLLAFGVPRTQAEDALARVAGKVDNRSANKECGAGAMEFTSYGDLTVNFQGDRFVGWYLAAKTGEHLPQYSTMSGISIGTSRAEAEKSVTIVDFENSTLGDEFSIGAGPNQIGGMFSGRDNAAKVVSLFAGINCFAR